MLSKMQVQKFRFDHAKKEFRVKLPSVRRSDRTKSVQVTSYEIQQRNDDAIEFGASLERVSVATGS